MKIFRILNKENHTIAENIPEECKSCYNQCDTVGRLISNCIKFQNDRRCGKIENNRSVVFLCDETKTTKLFREKIEALSYAIPDILIAKEEIEEKIRKQEQEKVNRLVHNLTSINAHNIQEIYDIVPQDILSSNWRNQIAYIEKEVKSNYKKVAEKILRITKNCIHMKSEFSIYRKLDRENRSELDFKIHPIRKVILNVLHTFFVDFSNNSVYVNVDEYNGRISIDYETIQVALYHLIENATKYVKYDSEIYISFEETSNKLKVIVAMQSLHVPSDERETIFNEGISGTIAKKMLKSGNGIGMWRIRQMMLLNDAEFVAEFGDEINLVNGFPFSNNNFIFIFNN